jgi:hypothetical protein
MRPGVCVDLLSLLTRAHRIATWKVPQVMGEVLADQLEKVPVDFAAWTDAYIHDVERGGLSRPLLRELIEILTNSKRLSALLPDEVRAEALLKLSALEAERRCRPDCD